MSKLFYPAVFHAEDVGFSVVVPDLDGCFSEGDTLEQAYDMTFDAIGLCLEDYQANNQPYPQASIPSAISASAPDFVVLVEFNPVEYAKKHDTRAVKKTLTIPSWLNHLAEERHVNFSSVLKDALIEHLNIN